MSMDYQEKYYGGFTDISGTEWKIQIFQKSETNIASKEVAFGSSPLEIEWLEVDKLEPVCSSKATLTLFSDTDQQFISLYTVEPGSIYLKVFRENQPYWIGSLDPELYEEPYSHKENYYVTLTFSDFAILDRTNWEKTGFMSLRKIVETCLSKAKLQTFPFKEYISTQFDSFRKIKLLDEVSVYCENYFDEDGEAMSVREVLEETLRPFTLRIIQKGGYIIIYDLHAVSTTVDTNEIYWTGEDAVLGVDKIYNNVKVCYNPYFKSELFKLDIKENTFPETPVAIIPVKVDYEKDSLGKLKSAEGFKMSLFDSGEGVKKGSGAKFFKIEPVFSGNEETGVAWTAKTILQGNKYTSYINEATDKTGRIIMQSENKAFITEAFTSNIKNYKLKITLDLLVDVRYNPFENVSVENEEGNWKRLKEQCNYAYVPYILNLHTHTGEVYHWENKEAKSSGSYNTAHKCSWEKGKGSMSDAFLCFYDFTDRKDSTGLGGWQQNKPIIGHWRKGLPESFQKRGNGEIIPIPPKEGMLELIIGAGVITYDNESDYQWVTKKGIYDKIRWVLYKTPTVTLVDTYGKNIDPVEIEHSAWIDRFAKESIEIETILGTLPQRSPTAIGQLFHTEGKTVIGKFCRANHQDLLERLLIGTVYSNYSGRNNTLSGSATLLPEFGVYRDLNMKGKYILLSELQRIRENESEVKLVAVNEDTYEGIEYQEKVV